MPSALPPAVWRSRIRSFAQQPVCVGNGRLAMISSAITRRESLIALGAAASSLVVWEGATWTAAAAPNLARRRVLRVAHLTDVHVQPERRAGDGMTACLHHVQQLADRPEPIFTGGDSIMDSFEADDARTTLPWDPWHRVLKDETSIAVRSCIGNRDVWGWAKSKSKTTGDEPNWGKRRAVEMLRLDERYYTFAQAGWQFIVLARIQPRSDGREGYTAYLDEPQRA